MHILPTRPGKEQNQSMASYKQAASEPPRRRKILSEDHLHALSEVFSGRKSKCLSLHTPPQPLQGTSDCENHLFLQKNPVWRSQSLCCLRFHLCRSRSCGSSRDCGFPSGLLPGFISSVPFNTNGREETWDIPFLAQTWGSTVDLRPPAQGM